MAAYHKLIKKQKTIEKEREDLDTLIIEVLDDLYDEIARLREEVDKMRGHDEFESTKLREIERRMKR